MSLNMTPSVEAKEAPLAKTTVPAISVEIRDVSPMVTQSARVELSLESEMMAAMTALEAAFERHANYAAAGLTDRILQAEKYIEELEKRLNNVEERIERQLGERSHTPLTLTFSN